MPDNSPDLCQIKISIILLSRGISTLRKSLVKNGLKFFVLLAFGFRQIIHLKIIKSCTLIAVQGLYFLLQNMLCNKIKFNKRLMVFATGFNSGITASTHLLTLLTLFNCHIRNNPLKPGNVLYKKRYRTEKCLEQ